MYYDTLSAHTVKITLTRKDMSEYSIKSENLRARNSESKRSLTRFLERFRTESSLFPDRSADRLFLEAFPSEDGGCVMYVSTLGVEPLPDSKEDPQTVTFMAAAESFGDISRLAACIAGKAASSVLYRVAGGWCLIAEAPRAELPLLSRLIGEFGEFSDDVTDICCTREHGTLICSDALQTLAGLI